MIGIVPGLQLGVVFALTDQETGHAIRSPVEQEEIQIITKHNDQDTAFTIDHHEIDNRLQRNENRDNNENPVLPRATLTGILGGVKVIFDCFDNFAYNIACSFVRCKGRLVCETDNLKRLLCFLATESVKRSAKSLMNLGWLIIKASYLTFPLPFLCILCYAVYIDD